MPRKCSVCSDSRRDAIDRALIAGHPAGTVAARFALSVGAVGNHRQTHLVPAVRQLVLDQLDELDRRLGVAIDDAQERGDFRGVARLIARLLTSIEVRAHLVGAFPGCPPMSLKIMFMPDRKEVNP